MLFSNLNRRYDVNGKLNEGNFISKDITGFFDATAKPYLSKLTIDKLFEGLDLEKSQELHSSIVSAIPSIKDAMGLNRANNTMATELIRKQLIYMQGRLDVIEKEMIEVSNKILSVTASSKNPEDARTAVASVTGPEGIGSIYPRIEKIILKYKGTIDLTKTEVKPIIQSLSNIKMYTIIESVMKSIDGKAATAGIEDIYAMIDSIELPEIEASTSSVIPVDFLGKGLKPIDLVKSSNAFERLAGFFEMVISKYDFGRRVKDPNGFGDGYGRIRRSGSRVMFPTIIAINTFLNMGNKSFDIASLEPLSDFLTEIGSELVNRIYANSPDEDSKNLFTPIFQVMFVSLLSILALKLISFDIAREGAFAKKEEEVKLGKEKEATEQKKKDATSLIEAGNMLYDDGFFDKKREIIRVGTRTNPEMIKHLNTFLVYLNLLPKTKMNDTTFDAATADAVKVFQTRVSEQDKAIKIDGIIGNETRAAMFKAFNDIKKKYTSTSVPTSTYNTASAINVKPQDVK
jgi:hypothetical protein